MNTVRKTISLIIMGILSGLLLLLLGHSYIINWVSILVNDYGQREYLAASVNVYRRAALVSQEKDSFLFTTFLYSSKVKHKQSQKVKLPSISAADCTVAEICPVLDGKGVLFGIYEASEERAADHLSVYYLPPDNDKVDFLCSVPCEGENVQQRMANTFLSEFTVIEAKTCFAIVSGTNVQPYCYEYQFDYNTIRDPTIPNYTFTEGVPVSAYNVRSALVYDEDKLALGGDGWLTLNGEPVSFPMTGQIVTHLSQLGSNFYYLDSANFQIYSSNSLGTECTNLYDFNITTTDDTSVTDLVFLEQGNTVALLDGHLWVQSVGGAVGLLPVLYSSPMTCVLGLVGFLLLFLLITALLWYYICGKQRNYMPLMLRMGSIVTVFLLTIGFALHSIITRSMTREIVFQETENVIQGVCALYPTEELPYINLADQITNFMEGGNIAVTVEWYEKQEDDVWRLLNDSGNVPARSQALLTNHFYIEAAEEALDTETVVSNFNSEGIYQFYLAANPRVIRVTLSGSAVLAEQQQNLSRKLVVGIWTGITLTWLCMLAVFWAIWWQIKQITYATGQLSEGKTDLRLKIYTGDEFEGLANTLNGLALTMRQTQKDKEDFLKAYLRFVPERVLNLLEQDSVMKLSKQTVASRRMAAMTVYFTFPDKVYGGATRILFDSINQVIERTAAVVTQKNGTVFNFGYNSYNVVLDTGAEEAISTAVAIQHEILSFNERRLADDLPTVTLRIALDFGEVIIGIVGDETQMEPTTISNCFTVTSHLIDLAAPLEAGILCTENIISGAKQYSSRYLGKSRQGTEFIRVYEIIDGDPYVVRQNKENTISEFSEGIFALYSQDFATAKRIFLKLAHDYPNDGGARYYLYLADRLEKQPDIALQEISLESD